MNTNPQVAQPIITVKDSVTDHLGRTLKGKKIIFPGFEEFDFVLTKPFGSKSKGTKHGFEVYEKTTGRLVSVGATYLDSESEVISMTLETLNHFGVQKIREIISSVSK